MSMRYMAALQVVAIVTETVVMGVLGPAVVTIWQMVSKPAL